jgi:hypothetical protein
MTEITIQTITEAKGNMYFRYINKNYPQHLNKQVRQNGKVKLWKTRPTEFKIPVKYGLYEYFYITQDNAHEWEII